MILKFSPPYYSVKAITLLGGLALFQSGCVTYPYSLPEGANISNYARIYTDSHMTDFGQNNSEVTEIETLYDERGNRVGGKYLGGGFQAFYITEAFVKPGSYTAEVAYYTYNPHIGGTTRKEISFSVEGGHCYVSSALDPSSVSWNGKRKEINIKDVPCFYIDSL